MPRPEDTPLTQQRLPSWQPIMTPRVARASFAARGCMASVTNNIDRLMNIELPFNSR